MKELSIFVDESGDFGEFDHRAPYYIISLVFHDQSNDISEDLQTLESEMVNIGWPEHCFHAGPIIRSENEYKDYSLGERQRLLKRLMTFTRKVEIKATTIYVEKKKGSDEIDITNMLSKQLADFIRRHLDFFANYNAIKLYYDNGQTEVTKILVSVFNTLLDNVEFKRVIPSNYRLFQVADLMCTLKLTELKMNKHILSRSEIYFFKDERTFKKNYIKPIERKIF
ncbi:MAG: DUF3800 domain-containing protein [Clostridiales bacterium]|nr:DUF3800 domain-containing protein [Clostridiales bacterium]